MSARKLFDKDMEEAVLACMVINSSVVPNIQRKIFENDFFDAFNRIVFRAISALYTKGYVDIVSLNAETGGVNPGFIAGLTDIIPSASNWDYYATKVKTYSVLRRTIAEAEELLSATAETINEKLDESIRNLSNVSDSSSGSSIKSARDLILPMIEKVEAACKNRGNITGLPTGFACLDEKLDGWQNELYIFGARPSQGKAQPLNAKIKTISGWKEMGDISVGDKIASIDGKESFVTGVFPQGIKDVYRVTFSDGRSTECCLDHLWEVSNPHRSEKSTVINTKNLKLLTENKWNKNRICVKTVSGDFGVSNDLPIDPWLLGFLIGDGCFTGGTISFSTADKEIVERIKDIVSPDMNVSYVGKYDYRIVKLNHGHNNTPVKDAVIYLGLDGLYSHEKFIPSQYLESNKDVRVSLLSGLISSDGEATKFGTVSYSTTSEKLCNDIIYLSRSLGFICSKETRQTYFTYKGIKKPGLISYRINILMSNEMKENVFFLPRHKDRIVKTRTRGNRLSVTSVEYSRTCEAQCIMVSHESHLYITDDFIVTHNTACAVNSMLRMARKGIKVGLVSAEMKDVRIMLRLLSDHTGINSRSLRNGILSEKNIQQVCTGGDALSQLPIYIDDSSITLEGVVATCRVMRRVLKVQIIFIDHLGMISMNDKLPAWEKESKKSKTIKALQKELGIPIVALSQVGRQVENKMPTLADLRGTGSYEEDADTVIFLHRERLESTDDTPIPAVLNVAKCRDGEIGLCDLLFFPKITRFADVEKDRKIQ